MSSKFHRAVGNALILSGHIPDFFPNKGEVFSIAFILRGTSTIEWKAAGKVKNIIARAGGFSISPGWGMSAFRTVSPLETLNLGITPDQLTHILEREFAASPKSVELVENYQKTNPDIVALGQAFASLLRSPRPGGGLYAETLWTQITMQLIWNYSNLPKPADSAYEKLSDRRIQRVVDYLNNSLHEEVSLVEMANLVGLTPNYFLNAFKKATGKTPHRYLRDLRMIKARELLGNPQLTVLGVALAVGYTTQSHFTTLFSKETGMTPARYRSSVLGIKTT